MRRVEDGIDYVNGADAPVERDSPILEVPDIEVSKTSHSIDAVKE